MKTLFHSKLNKLNRRFYEVFGDLESQAEFLKLIVFIQSAIVILLLVGAYFLAEKPPLVIRVSELGESKIFENTKTETDPADPELIFFARTFVKRFSELNAYTLSRDFEEAFRLMTRRCQERVEEEYIRSGLLSKVKAAGLNTRIEIREERIEKNTPEFVVLSLTGVRTITSYTNSKYKDSSFVKWDIVLKKYPRSVKVPSGLLVDNSREILLNKLEENK
ncbi:MAG: hypothetical protein HY586_01605 [Candidatus Omnitrophica bacterium]|nr:hypothetical protein [Candidatus Omnitrophota bacterium]